MSKDIVEKLKAQFTERLLEVNDFRGDDEVCVAPKDWLEVAKFLRDDPACSMKQFVDLTAVDYIEREPKLPRFDVLLSVRSVESGKRMRVKTQLRDGEKLSTLVKHWAGANWAEREVWDMFGIAFEGHPDLRRILMYDEFVGFPLRKDYPIDRVQPLVPYRTDAPVNKLPPFGIEEGQPFARIDWEARLKNADEQVSPAIALQVGQRRILSDSEIAQREAGEIVEQKPVEGAPQ